MAEPTPEELDEAGIELTPIPPPADEIEPVKFEQVDDLPGEPVTDVKIRLEDGTELRERLIEVPVADGFNCVFSNALLDKSGKVAKDPDGNWRIVPPEVLHEFSVTGVRAGLMTPKQIKAARDHARGMAAAKAKAYFTGTDRMRRIFSDRTA